MAAAHAGPAIAVAGTFHPSLCPDLAGRGVADHVAFTFDDGPDPGATPAFIEALAACEVTATFFMLGAAVARAPGLAAEVAAAGHEIGVHGWTHRPLLRCGPRTTRDDLARARDKVAEATGKNPWLFRPAYGILTGSALAAARSLGLTPVLWTAWGREWRPGATTAMVLATITAALDGGGCLLLHDSDRYAPSGSWRAGLGAVAPLLDECARRGWRAGPLGEHGERWRHPAAP
ncbi:MAG TPA: polysaccharide deacetylase family protein [Streptosporangiaceae bacterium]|nr:polysaccharide deacetylase family protein [Streptosporangiaceae bacterium]